MDGLITEAADLILSSSRSNSLAGSSPELKLEQEKDREPSKEVNSVSLLRLSITRSIKNRCTEVETTDGSTSKQKKSKRYKEPSVKSKIDVQMLNTKETRKITPSTPEKLNSIENTDKANVLIEDEDKTDLSKAVFSRLISVPEEFDPEKTIRYKTEMPETDNESKVNEINSPSETELEVYRKGLENGLKLARRKFSDGIFENCSTYSLAGHGTVLDKDNVLSSKEDGLKGSNQSLDKTSMAGADLLDDRGSEISINSGNDDQISLGDSFFANVTNDDCANSTSFFRRKATQPKVSNKPAKNSLPKENDSSNAAEIIYQKNSSVNQHQNRERKLRKRYRKKQRKNKCKDTPMYECPKCGVSYILSSNAVDSAARCLHCDFWTSVEPVFLRREKQVWNTCRIC